MSQHLYDSPAVGRGVACGRLQCACRRGTDGGMMLLSDYFIAARYVAQKDHHHLPLSSSLHFLASSSSSSPDVSALFTFSSQRLMSRRYRRRGRHAARESGALAAAAACHQLSLIESHFIEFSPSHVVSGGVIARLLSRVLSYCFRHASMSPVQEFDARYCCLRDA